MSSYIDLLKDYYVAWNSRDADQILAFFTEDGIYIDHAVGVEMNLASAKKFLNDFIGSYPKSFEARIVKVLEAPAQQMVAYEWDVAGERADGEKMFIRGSSMVTFRGNKICRNVDYWDFADSPEGQAMQRAMAAK